MPSEPCGKTPNRSVIISAQNILPDNVSRFRFNHLSMPEPLASHRAGESVV